MLRNPICVALFALSRLHAQTPDVVPDVSAGLTLEKSVYLAGEPIILTFTARNTGFRPMIEIYDSGRYGECGPYRVKDDADRTVRELASGPSCAGLFLQMFHCLMGAIALPKGEIVERRILLNRLAIFRRPAITSFM